MAHDLHAIPVTFLVPPSSRAPMEIELRHQVLRMVVVDKDSVSYLPEFWAARGVYFLLGHAAEPSQYTAYVGKAPGGLASRVGNHVRSREDPWQRALLVASATPSGFDSAAIGWLEGRLYDLLDIAPAAILLNRNRPRDESLPLYDRQVLEQHIPPIAAVLRALGYSPDSPDQRPPAPPRTIRRQYSGSIADLIAAGFLRAGTRLRSTAAVEAVATVLEDGRLDIGSEIYESPSAAGAAVLGRNVNGWDFWAAPSGEGSLIPLAALRDRLGEEGPRETSSTAESPRAEPRNRRTRKEEAVALPPSDPSSPVSSPRHYDVSMADLIDAGLIAAEGPLVSHFRGGGHEAHYTRDSVEHKGVVYRSPSMAGKAAIGRNVNGWDFWHVQCGGQLVKLAAVRDQYLRSRDAQ